MRSSGFPEPSPVEGAPFDPLVGFATAADCRVSSNRTAQALRTISA
jgi:hypothetical protein